VKFSFWSCAPGPLTSADYDHDITWRNGTIFHAVRRERPWLLFENGRATCLFTAVYDGQRTWNQPVPIR
jgi:hypothetical protein